MTSTTIATTAGAKKYVGGTITETTGKDITTATIQIALGPSKVVVPTTGWVTPDVSVAGPGATIGGVAIPPTAQRVVKLLVTNATPPGLYYCWVRITDNPEVEPIMIQGPIIIT